MKHALLAAVAVAALAFPGLAATAAGHPTRAAGGKPVKPKVVKPVHQMLGAVPPFIRTGPRVGEGYVLPNRSPRPALRRAGRQFATDDLLPNDVDNLTYGLDGQVPPKSQATLPRVMTYNTNYAIYWVPDGYRQASNYQSTIDQYFTDVAQESGNDGNVDSPSVQYYGSADDGPIFYDSTFGGSAVDTHPFPKGQCNKSLSAINLQADTGDELFDPSDVGHETPFTHIHTLGVSFCLTDSQLSAEVKRFADSQGWPHGPNVEFFLYTPHNVYSCFNADGQSYYPFPPNAHAPDVWNTCSYDYYCAYHSSIGTTPKTEYIYANMPWPNQAYSYTHDSGNLDPWKKSACDPGEHPNGTGSLNNGTDPQGATDADAADEVINVTSHEHNESVTDPTGYGWYDANPDSPFYGYEDGDLCAWDWTNFALGSTSDNGSFYTNELNGDYYFLQGEWSNGDATIVGWSGCMWDHAISTPTPSTDAVLSTSGDVVPVPGDTLTMTGGDFPAGTAMEFVWLRCQPSVSMAAAKAIAVKHTVKSSAADPCAIVADDFTADDTAPADDYLLTSKDVHMDVIAYVFGWDGTDPSVEFADMTVGGEPISQSTPTITLPVGVDAPVVGTKLTADVGTWSGTPTSFTAGWQRCTSDSLDSCKTFRTVALKPSAPTTTYTLTPADVRDGINFVVTAKNALGTSDPASSGMTDTVGGVPTPSDTDGPAWTDAPAVGTADTLDLAPSGLASWDVPAGAPVTSFSGTIRRCAVVLDSGVQVADLTSCEGSTPFSGTPTSHTVHYTPVLDDDQYFLVAFVTAKNKNGASFADPVVAGIVGGHPTVTDDPTVTADNSPAAPGDTVTIHLGTWTGSPSTYRVVLYSCLDPSVVTQCTELVLPAPATAVVHVLAPDTTFDVTAPDLGIPDYYIRANIVAINGNGFSDDVWTAADGGGGEVTS